MLPFLPELYWTWFLVFLRFSGLALSIPGIGTDEIPFSARGAMVLVLSAAVGIATPSVPVPPTLVECMLCLTMEFLFGWLIGAIPTFVTASLAVAGQVSANAIGLAQANLIDPSLGETVSVLARMQVMFGTLIFLTIDGHHLILRAAAGVDTPFLAGSFRPTGELAELLVSRFQFAFEFGLALIGPVLAAVLISNFILGLVTKFVPQVNIFIVSLPLTIGLGLFLIEVSMPVLTSQVAEQMEEAGGIAVSIVREQTKAP